MLTRCVKIACLLIHVRVFVLAGAEFDYAQQGDDWSGLCTSGSRQSPIDIHTDSVEDGTGDPENELYMNFRTRIDLKRRDASFEVANTGESLKVTANSSSFPLSVFVNATTNFELLQYHFHGPSEHTIDETQRDLEAHGVFSNGLPGDEQRLVVLGLTFFADDSVDDHPVLEALILSEAPENAGETKTVLNDYIGFNMFFEDDSFDENENTLIRYEGSLTTPPCSEIVTWFLFVDPVRVPTSQIDWFTERFAYPNSNGNYRNVQNSRNSAAIPTKVPFTVGPATQFKSDTEGEEGRRSSSAAARSATWRPLLLASLGLPLIRSPLTV